MVRFSVLLMSAFGLGFCMFTSGLVCMVRGLDFYQKDEAHNAILRLLIGSVLLVFGPVIIAVEDYFRLQCTCAECEAQKKPGAQLRQRSQNAQAPRLCQRRD